MIISKPESDLCPTAPSPSEKLRSVFGRKRVFLPVIHPKSAIHAHASIETAMSAGADGVFLINQGMGINGVLRLAHEVKQKHPKLWIGLNLLGVPPLEVVEVAREFELHGVWTDASVQMRGDRPWSGLTFGGCAFKYQKPVPDDALGDEARRMSQLCDVVTTSGPGTAEEAGLAKVMRISAALGGGASVGGHPLALASGVTPQNIDRYLPHVDAYLVASGIEREFGVLDADRTKMLSDRIHAFVATS